MKGVVGNGSRAHIDKKRPAAAKHFAFIVNPDFLRDVRLIFEAKFQDARVFLFRLPDACKQVLPGHSLVNQPGLRVVGAIFRLVQAHGPEQGPGAYRQWDDGGIGQRFDRRRCDGRGTGAGGSLGGFQGFWFLENNQRCNVGEPYLRFFAIRTEDGRGVSVIGSGSV